jgi:hypothetical protein
MLNCSARDSCELRAYFACPFPHHVNHLDAAQDRPSGRDRLEPKHWSNPALDGPMILLDAIVQVGTLPDPDRLQIAPRSVLEPVHGIAGQDRLSVGLAAINHDPLRSSVSLQCLAQEALSGREIAPFAEPELDRIAVAVDGTVQIPPVTTNFDVGLINVPLARDRSLAPIELLQQAWRKVDSPAMDCGVVDGDASLGHHLLEIAQAQAVSQIPPDTEQDD